ncbi:MAG: haloacid dehalogenase-like hydrolase [Muribaculaceae bacterium]|nr:haloacid dehalogenase-like hydrolase [Muribaculaceae bacterium]
MTDLDGTLLAGNSMKRFMRWLPGELWRRNPFRACESLLWIALRGARLVSHRRMKWHLGHIALLSLSASDWQRFASEALLPMLNPGITELIRGLQEKGTTVCIASAAMEDYVAPLCRLLGYDHHLATRHSPRISEYTELRGVRKLRAIDNLASKEDLFISLFLTDHADDLPTAAAYPAETIIVNPTPQSDTIFADAGIKRRL